MDAWQRIKELEEEIKRTQKNKATEYHIGVLKSKIAKLRREALGLKAKKGKRTGFDIRKQGDATVVIVGMPSVGKSTLITKITNAESKVAAYQFTTVKCIPGMMEYRGANIQVLDLPGLIKGAREGKGRGKEVISVVRGADLILILLDATRTEDYSIIEQELEGFGIRLNKRPPDVIIKKIPAGGVTITYSKKPKKITENEIRGVLNEYRVFNANVLLREDVTIDELIDVLEGNRVYIPAIMVANKADLLGRNARIPQGAIAISAEKEENLDLLREKIFEKLGLIRIFTKKQGKEANLEEPLVMKKGSTVGDFCDKVHRTLRKEFRYAMVWGKSVKHQPQRVGLEHIVEDGDIVMIIKR
jgi:small GTP-binding protein